MAILTKGGLMLTRFGRLFAMMFLVALSINLMLFSMGYAQDATPAAAPWWKAFVDMALVSLLPALWAAVGPTVTAVITKGVNTFAGTYVPRPAQVVLSGLITATLAGLSGDPAGMAQAAVQGASGQVLAATKPETLLTSARPD